MSTADYLSAQRYARAKVRSIVGVDNEDDVLQTAALKAFVKRAQFRKECEFRTWFYRIAVREALYHLRKNWRRTEELSPLLEAREEEQGERLDREDRERKLYEAILALCPNRKRAALRWLAGEKTTDGREKMARHMARVKLREMLDGVMG